MKDYDLETLRNQVAMVLQKNVLFSGTIKENLRWGSESATDEELVHACSLPGRMNLSLSSRTDTTPISNREAPMCPAGRSSASVLPGLC
mgnify:CR=1 FL=1